MKQQVGQDDRGRGAPHPPEPLLDAPGSEAPPRSAMTQALSPPRERSDGR